MAEQRQTQETGSTQGQAGAEKTSGTQEAAGAQKGSGAQETGMQPSEQQSAPLQRPHRGIARGLEGSPFAMMRHFTEEIDRAFSSMFGGRSPLAAMTPFEVIASGGWVPAIESFEQDGNIVLRAELPGMRPEDVRVEVVGDELVISGERVHEKKETKGGFYSERHYGCFERRVTLPEGCNPEKIDAMFEDGVLTVSVSAPEKQKSRKVDVKSKSSQQESAPAEKGAVH